MAGLIDPTVTGNYPVILSESLLGGTRNNVFTGIRYNHKPDLAGGAPEQARLKPSVPGDTSSYDLSFADKSGNYAFAGARNSADGQYVLYFDPQRKAFILDRVESTFDMNLTRLPNNSDPDSLSRKYPHLGSEANPKPEPTKKTADKEIRKPAPKARPSSAMLNQAKRKPEKKQAPKSTNLALPQPEKPKPKPSKLADEDEDEDDDDDGGLLIEYPGAAPRSGTNFSPAFPSVRRFDEFMDQRESEGDDADGESDDEPDAEFKLPSPVNNPAAASEPDEEFEQEPEHMEVDNAGDDEDDGDDFGNDLDRDLHMALEGLHNTNEGSNQDNNQGSNQGSDESEISEED